MSVAVSLLQLSAPGPVAPCLSPPVADGATQPVFAPVPPPLPAAALLAQAQATLAQAQALMPPSVFAPPSVFTPPPPKLPEQLSSQVPTFASSADAPAQSS